jgi:hypothetical protein
MLRAENPQWVVRVERWMNGLTVRHPTVNSGDWATYVSLVEL